jgi:hypothetical protein
MKPLKRMAKWEQITELYNVSGCGHAVHVVLLPLGHDYREGKRRKK